MAKLNLKIDMTNTDKFKELYKQRERFRKENLALILGLDNAIEEIETLEKALEHIAAMCGNPDPAEACRVILWKIKKMEAAR